MNKLKELTAKLREIFQIDRPELDFGVYRIIGMRAPEIEKFLDETLPGKVAAALSSGNDGDSAQKQQELKALTATLQDAGVNPESSPKYTALKAEVEQLKAGNVDYEGRVYAHLLNFFSRYYDKGDFISKRRYKGDTYAVPYAGEEVLLYWANFDQYYIKSGENFSNYTIKLDEKRKVHFRLISADTAKDNRKDNDLERCFVLAEPRDITRVDEDGNETVEKIIPINHGVKPDEFDDLVILFDYLPMPKGTKQAELVATAVKQVLTTTNVLTYWPELAGLRPTEKNKERTLLEKALTDYVSKNKADYFIHKDLGKFLRRELDFYIKNEMLHLDDIQHVETFREIEKNLKMIQCMRAVAEELITFMAQLENFQKKLWLKKKFVTQSDYCITLDRVPVEFYPEIIRNLRQWREWEKLGFLTTECDDSLSLADTKEPVKIIIVTFPDAQYPYFIALENAKELLIMDNFGMKERKPGTPSIISRRVSEKDFFTRYSHMMLDTQFFDANFKARLLASIPDLDDQCDGLLIHSENFQALNLLQERYREQVKCIYIDPPYNTRGDGFIYRDNYRHSSWLCLMADRLNFAYHLMKDDATFFSSIDHNELHLEKKIFETLFGEDNFEGLITWRRRHNQPNDKTKMLGMVSEYILSYAKDSCAYKRSGVGKLDITGKFSNPDNDPRGDWASKPWKVGSDQSGSRYKITTPSGVILDEEWMGEETTYKQLFSEGRIYFPKKSKNEDGSPRKKYYKCEREKEGQCATNWWSHEQFGHNQGANDILTGLMGEKNTFSNSKPYDLIRGICLVANTDNKIILDFFAGSGTTGHAVINLNREDGGKRKYILVEMGDYFDKVLKPRIQKVIFSKEWKDGKPVEFDKTRNTLKARNEEDLFSDSSVVNNPYSGVSHCFKYLKLESYEDTLNNLSLVRSGEQQELLGLDGNLHNEYLLRYMLDLESRGSLLSTDDFKKPFDYMLNIAVDSAGAMQPVKIDLVETFNYLIGLRVKHLQHWPERGICIIEGMLPSGENALILWRDCEKVGYEALNKFCDSMGINPRESIYDVVYINGDNTVANQSQSLDSEGGITKILKLRQIEEEFLSKMFQTL